MKKTINLLLEFSVALVAGVTIALVWVNLSDAGLASRFVRVEKRMDYKY